MGDILLVGCVSDMVCTYEDTAELWIIYCYCSCVILSLYPPSYNTARCVFCVTVCHLLNEGIVFTA